MNANIKKHAKPSSHIPVNLWNRRAASRIRFALAFGSSTKHDTVLSSRVAVIAHIIQLPSCRRRILCVCSFEVQNHHPDGVRRRVQVCLCVSVRKWKSTHVGNRINWKMDTMYGVVFSVDNMLSVQRLTAIHRLRSLCCAISQLSRSLSRSPMRHMHSRRDFFSQNKHKSPSNNFSINIFWNSIWTGYIIYDDGSLLVANNTSRMEIDLFVDEKCIQLVFSPRQQMRKLKSNQSMVRTPSHLYCVKMHAMQTVSDKSLAQCCIQQIVLIILYRCISVRFIHFYSIIRHHGYSCECEWFAKMQIDAMLAFRPRLGQYKQAKHRTHCVFAWRRDHSVCGLKRRPSNWMIQL